MVMKVVGDKIHNMPMDEWHTHCSIENEGEDLIVYSGRWSSLTYGFLESRSKMGSSKFVVNAEILKQKWDSDIEIIKMVREGFTSGDSHRKWNLVYRTQREINNGIWTKE